VALIPIAGVDERALAGRFPMFVKPAKGTFSLFAKMCSDFPELARHLDFGVFERLDKTVGRPDVQGFAG
jgi:hypothetical protein